MDIYEYSNLLFPVKEPQKVTDCTFKQTWCHTAWSIQKLIEDLLQHTQHHL